MGPRPRTGFVGSGVQVDGGPGPGSGPFRLWGEDLVSMMHDDKAPQRPTPPPNMRTRTNAAGSLWYSHQKTHEEINLEVPCDPGFSDSGYIPKRTERRAGTGTCTLMSTAAEKREQYRCPPTGWTQTQNVVHPHKEHYSALRRKETLTHVTTWMNLEDIMLSEKKPDTKRKHMMLLP